MRRKGPGGRRGRSVPVDHFAAAPSCEAHQVTFRTALGQPLEGDLVPELMGMREL